MAPKSERSPVVLDNGHGRWAHLKGPWQVGAFEGLSMEIARVYAFGVFESDIGVNVENDGFPGLPFPKILGY
jgi:hypothetical protein